MVALTGTLISVASNGVHCPFMQFSPDGHDELPEHVDAGFFTVTCNVLLFTLSYSAYIVAVPIVEKAILNVAIPSESVVAVVVREFA